MHGCNTTYTRTRYIIYLMVLHDNLFKKEEKHTDIQYKSKPKYILWQHRTFHIPLWDKGHTTPEVFDFFFFLVKYTLFFFCLLTYCYHQHNVIYKMSNWQFS